MSYLPSSIETLQTPGHMLMPMEKVEMLFERCKDFSGKRACLTALMYNTGRVLRPSVFSRRNGETEKVPASMSIDVSPGQAVVIGLGFRNSIARRVGRPIAHLERGTFEQDFGDAESVEKGYRRIEAQIGLTDGDSVMTAEKVGGQICLLTGVTYEEVALFSSACVDAFRGHRAKHGLSVPPVPFIDSQE